MRMPVIADLLFAPIELRPAPIATAEPDAIVIVIDGKAVAKGRPRFTRQGIAYTPAATRKWESSARLIAQEAMTGRAPLDGPIEAVVAVFLPIPQGMPKRDRLPAMQGRLFPITRPDIDQYIKIVLDACNSIVFRDDSQVVRLTAEKRYGDDPRLVITVRRARVDAALEATA